MGEYRFLLFVYRNRGIVELGSWNDGRSGLTGQFFKPAVLTKHFYVVWSNACSLFTMYRSINYTSLYLLPELVATTVPAWAPRRTGEVVISVPVRKALVLLTLPVRDPSGF